MSEEQTIRLMDELIEHQRRCLLEFAKRYIPNITEDDLLQPCDYKELELNPLFRHEEGILEGLLTAKMAFVAQVNYIFSKQK